MTRFHAIVQTISRLRSETRGAMLIETALVTPILVLMSIGSFEASQMFARESELQNAASEASAIALASSPDTNAKRTTLKSIIVTSTGLPTANVTVAAEFRCGANTVYVLSTSSCGTAAVSNFVRIYMTETYSPAWTHIGIGGNVTFRVTRYVMLGQG